jgi:hypothetical protein
VLQAIIRNQNTAAERIIVTATPTIADTDWHHVGFTFGYDEGDATRGLRMYIAGAPVAMSASSTGMAGADRDLSTTVPFTVSGRNNGQVDDGGLIDDLAVWKSVLTPQDFAAIGSITSTPEPASLAGLCVAALVLRRRGR